MEPNTALSERSLANPVGDKSARVHWYCAVADACLCQPCDLSVHSANHRIRLKTSSRSSPEDDLHKPAWHRVFSRKARTSRPKKKSGEAKDESGTGLNLARLVPDMCSEDNSYDENEEQLLHRVPRLDPFVADLCTLSEAFHNNDNNNSSCFGCPRPAPDGMGHFLPTEMDLAELAAYGESLLRNGLEQESLNMKGYRILDCDEDERNKAGLFNNKNNDFVEEGDFIGIGKEGFVLNFDYDSPVMSEEHKLQCFISEACDSKKIFLKLDYEGVMSSWDDRKSPWITGERPAFDSSSECWPDRVGNGTMPAVYEDEKGMISRMATVLVADGGREAKVSRYREKRRTRLFSKKIRYEVRKLNAEKRPRMKGRFVKRLSFVAPPFTFPQ